MCTDGVIAKQLVPLFCGRMGTARRLIWPSLMQETCTGGSWRILQCRWAVRERISVPDVTTECGIFQGSNREDVHLALSLSNTDFFEGLYGKFFQKITTKFAAGSQEPFSCDPAAS